MSKSVAINLGCGDLNNGFPRVTAQLWVAGSPLPEQFIGSLPAAPYLVELQRNWQSIYYNLCDRQMLRSWEDEDDDQLEIEEVGLTNVSVFSFNDLSQQLQQGMNQWLNCAEFFQIERQLRSQLKPTEEIRVIIETNEGLLRQLPWHRWNFCQDYPRAEIALAQLEYKNTRTLEKPSSHKVRILAILGNSQGIDLEAETKFLNSLPDAEIVELVNPIRQELNTQLWDARGWDILFFAGHSQSEGTTGRIYINENETNNSLTIEQLEEALKASVEKGLSIAIFNSCDGLGLASALEKLHIPTMIVMREPVPNIVAQEFFVHFMQAFAVERQSFYLAVQRSRRKLQGLEDDFPGASWLPVICQNPAIEPPTWLKLGGIPPCPYRGLFAFREEDAHLFFGREQFQTELVKAVKRKPIVAVVGASGSGKSSVVFAGLVPQLRQDPNIQWQIVSFRPGYNPIDALARAIAPLDGGSRGVGEQGSRGVGEHRIAELELEIAIKQDKKVLYKVIEKHVQQFGTRLVLIVDQFEELYTLSVESERQPFLDALLTACNAPAFTLVTTLRADFFGHALSYRPFSDALQGAVLNLGPMSTEELRNAIEKPAAQMQVGLEKELTNTLISAVEEQSGSLPLLEFALTQLWSKQQYGLLTNQAYAEIGGVEEALANHAEAVYTQLDEENRARTQRVFMQLVRLGEETEPTRRLATRDEVNSENWDLVTRLASNRLVVTNRNSSGEETVEIVHEALIRSWGRLEQWIQVDGEFRRWQEQLRTAMRQWENSDRDEGGLLRGKPLADAEYWQHQRLDELSAGERSFIQLGLELRDRELKNQQRRQKLTISGLATGLVIALSLAGVAWWQSHKANINEIEALTKSSEALFASNNRLDALLDAIKAEQKLKTVGGVGADIKARVDSLLRKAIYGAVEHNRLSGHNGAIWAVAFSPNPPIPRLSGGYGGIIATSSDDKTVKLWQRDGNLLATLNGHSQAVYGVAFSPTLGNSGSYKGIIATASGDQTVKLWQPNGQLVRTLKGHSDVVYGVAFSPDGKILATASGDQTVRLWKVSDGTLLTTLNGHNFRVNAVAFSPDGNTIASASADKTIKLWNSDGRLRGTLNGHKDTVSAVAFSPDGKTIASTSWDLTVNLWRASDGRLLRTLNGHSDRLYGVAFSPDSKIIASTSWDRTVKLWRLDGTLINTFIGHDDFVSSVAFSPDGKTIASASGDKTVKLWKLDNTLLTTLNDHSAGVNAVAFSPQGNIIATGTEDNKIQLWKPDGLLLRILNSHRARVWGVAFSPDGQKIASASSDTTVKLWNVDGRLLRTLNGHSYGVNAVAFSSDGEKIATGSDDRTVKIWRVSDGEPALFAQRPAGKTGFPSQATDEPRSRSVSVRRRGKLITTLNGHGSEIWGVAFSHDGQMIASASSDKTVKIWQPDGRLLHTLNGHSDGVKAVAFSPDGEMIATGSKDKTVKLWKSDGTLITTLNGHNGAVWGVAFSPDGKMIATSSNDKTVKLWKRNGTLLTTINGHSKPVWGVAFSPDGKTIVSASEDKTAILWKLDRVLDQNQLLAYSCNWVSDYLKTNTQVQKSDRDLCAGVKTQ
ncbi:CHAT domain-containing protein [Iningainema tapete]|uniref:CHAT domain-containing protein n=1 Tax=Iningainema tapete BLCC-T55 TaxID=2748662 RepID=A0A8J6XKW1_9CYAN|nr:CHAT domain-containing protein [Iningainema tapete]MBD2778134.1 CHAT domain-containing protein [Iningainema tapete BLCC-T55]